MEKDILLLAVFRASRSFFFGYTAFMLPLYFESLGYSVVFIGIYSFLATTFSGALVLASGFIGDVFSRKKTLAVLSALPIFLFSTLLLTTNQTLIVFTSLAGVAFTTVGSGAGGGPVAPLQTSMIADRVEFGRTRIYSIFTIVSTLFAMVGGSFSSLVIRYSSNYYEVLFITALVLEIISVISVLFLKEVKIPGKRKEAAREAVHFTSGRTVAKIGMSGASGSFGLGMTIPLIAVWMATRGLDSLDVSIIFTLSYIATAIGSYFSGNLERRFGTISTIFYLRFMASGVMMIFPFVSGIIIGILYILRSGLYQMTIPLRQSFVMTLYPPNERARGLGFTSMARRIPYGISTTLGGILLSSGAIVALFSLSGGISLLDPVLYYVFFRKMEKSRT